MDLSSNENEGLHIEVRPNEYDYIPNNKISKLHFRKKFHIEKLHPHFIQSSLDDFINLIKNNPFYNVKIMYHIRDPKNSMISFLNYKKRNNNWGQGKTVPDFLLKQYHDIEYLHNNLKGLVTRYNNLYTNTELELNKTLKYLWPNKSIKTSITKKSIEKNSRSKKVKKYNKFLGKQEGSSQKEREEYINPLQ